MNKQPTHLPVEYVPYEEEVSLFDLFLVLTKHKTLMGVIVALGLVVGTIFALTNVDSYRFTSSLTIGSLWVEGPDGGRFVSVESPASVKAKLENAYIPAVLNQHYSAVDTNHGRLEIKAELPDNSNVVILISEGVAEEQATHAILHERVLQRVLADHNAVIDVSRQLQLNSDKSSRLPPQTVTETTVVESALRSADPVGMSSMWLFIAVAAVSLLLALISAFVAEFVARAAERIKLEEQN